MELKRMLYVAATCVIMLVIIWAYDRRVTHIKLRKVLRRCSRCHGDTRRRYMMVRNRNNDAAGRKVRCLIEPYHCYSWYIFDRCGSCGRVVCADKGVKRFIFWSLLWKSLTRPSQFWVDESLFDSAGPGTRIFPSLATKIFERAAHAKAERLMYVRSKQSWN